MILKAQSQFNSFPFIPQVKPINNTNNGSRIGNVGVDCQGKLFYNILLMSRYL